MSRKTHPRYASKEKPYQRRPEQGESLPLQLPSHPPIRPVPIHPPTFPPIHPPPLPPTHPPAYPIPYTCQAHLQAPAAPLTIQGSAVEAAWHEAISITLTLTL